MEAGLRNNDSDAVHILWIAIVFSLWLPFCFDILARFLLSRSVIPPQTVQGD